MKENQKYDIVKLLDFLYDIEEVLGGEKVIDYIAATPNEFSIYINHGVSMLLIEEIYRFEEIFIPDSVFFNENNPQLIIANTGIRDSVIKNTNVQYFINFVNDCAEYICPCTGSEIHIQDREIKIYIDQLSLLHNEYMGIYNLLDESNLIFKITLDRQRPYISIMFRGDVIDE